MATVIATAKKEEGLRQPTYVGRWKIEKKESENSFTLAGIFHAFFE